MAKKSKKKLLEGGDSMTSVTTLTPAQELMLEKLLTSRAIVTEAARNAGISRQTHYRWLDESVEYRQAYESIESTAIDFVEGKMFERIEEGSDSLIKFYLSTKAKARGYVEKQELKVEGIELQKQVTVNIVRAVNE